MNTTEVDEPMKQADAATVDEFEEQMWDMAASLGRNVVLPKENELFINVNGWGPYETFRNNIEILKKICPLEWKIEQSPSGHLAHFHVTITIKRKVSDPFERIMLQALLGSDLAGEIMNYKAAVAGAKNPVCFFEMPQAEEQLNVFEHP
jgi:hypothetical protein